MANIGNLIALASLYALYTNAIALGCIMLFIGGLLAGKLFFCTRSLGVIIIAGSTAFGFHNSFSTLVLLCLAIGIILALGLFRQRSSNNGGGGDGEGWFNLDFSSESDSNNSSDSSSDGGGGGGD